MTTDADPTFACDATLGGLARWLRAAGYDASWHDGIDDGDLVRLTRSGPGWCLDAGFPWATNDLAVQSASKLPVPKPEMP